MNGNISLSLSLFLPLSFSLSLSLSPSFSPSPCPSFPLCLFLPLAPPEGGNFRSVLDKAVQADQVVRERYNAHCEMIALLCKPEAELTAAIPSANPAKTLQGSEVCVCVCVCVLVQV